jgi:hypothetical protein
MIRAPREQLDDVLNSHTAAATMTIGIIAFLESTQAFFVAQRLVWAMIMIAIGMTMSQYSFLPEWK